METDSTGEPVSILDPNAPAEVQAAQRESAGSNEQTLVVEWDDDEWDIPTEPTIAYGRAIDRLNDNLGSPDANLSVLRSLLGDEQTASLGFADDSGLRDLMKATGEFIELANVAWGVPNFNRSARRSGRTTKR